MKTDPPLLSDLEVSADVRETAVRVGVLFRHLMAYGDGGQALRAIDELGLSFVQFKAMMELFTVDPGDPPYIQELAESLGASMPSLSRAVDGLVRKKLVSRSEDPDDRRRRRVALTPSGQEIVNRFFYSRAAGVIEFASSLSDEQRRMFDDAVGSLLEREDIAPIYEKFEGVIEK
ncbi:MAG: MarR family transcriptional regulator [Actinomycetota bacterium]|nr:MarR family transcriptional regulator [Actinomycetota bacterium]